MIYLSRAEVFALFMVLVVAWPALASAEHCLKAPLEYPRLPPGYFTCTDNDPPPDTYDDKPDRFGTTSWQWGWIFGHSAPLDACQPSPSLERGERETLEDERYSIGCVVGRIEGGRNTWRVTHPRRQLPDLVPDDPIERHH